ncbi:MAG: DNA polymerase III subunit epsilon [Alphaproteobacteria bacterium]|nr:DNA polymerase III subunit epsilon [Alphaproteobacteria bacterium]
MREIVLDTETTGTNADGGDRIVDIGCIELIDHRPTGRRYQVYINPERQMDQEVINIHGLTNEFLADKPKFADIADDFLEFIGSNPDDKLVIHNAPFDMKFLNMELKKAGKSCLSMDRAVDTLIMARRKYPGAPANLDALCKRFNVDSSRRTVHGALLDSELLVDVYLGMILDKELKFQPIEKKEKIVKNKNVSRETLPPREFKISEEEIAAHQVFIEKIKNNLWTSSNIEQSEKQ